MTQPDKNFSSDSLPIIEFLSCVAMAMQEFQSTFITELGKLQLAEQQTLTCFPPSATSFFPYISVSKRNINVNQTYISPTFLSSEFKSLMLFLGLSPRNTK